MCMSVYTYTLNEYAGKVERPVFHNTIRSSNINVCINRKDRIVKETYISQV